MNLTVNETLSPATKPTLNNERILIAAVFNVVENGVQNTKCNV